MPRVTSGSLTCARTRFTNPDDDRCDLTDHQMSSINKNGGTMTAGLSPDLESTDEITFSLDDGILAGHDDPARSRQRDDARPADAASWRGWSGRTRTRRCAAWCWAPPAASSAPAPTCATAPRPRRATRSSPRSCVGDARRVMTRGAITAGLGDHGLREAGDRRGSGHRCRHRRSRGLRVRPRRGRRGGEVHRDLRPARTGRRWPRHLPAAPPHRPAARQGADLLRRRRTGAARVRTGSGHAGGPGRPSSRRR